MTWSAWCSGGSHVDPDAALLGQPETAFDLDIRQIVLRAAEAVEAVIENELPATYWTGMLPQLMDTSSAQALLHRLPAAQPASATADSSPRLRCGTCCSTAATGITCSRKHLQKQGLSRGRTTRSPTSLSPRARSTSPSVKGAGEVLRRDCRAAVARNYGGITDPERLRENYEQNCCPRRCSMAKCRTTTSSWPSAAVDGADQRVVRGAV